MFKFQKYKLYLFSGRVVGGIEGGLIGVLFVSWIIPVIGQNGYALCDVLCTIAGAILAAVFALDSVIKFSIDRPYLLLYSMILGMTLDAGFMLIPGINPWVILFTGCIGCCVLGQGFFYARQAMINRKISGDSGTGFLLCSTGDDKQKDFWRFTNKTEQLSPNHWNGFCDYRSKFFGSDRTFLGKYGGRNTVFCCSVFPVVLYADF